MTSSEQREPLAEGSLRLRGAALHDFMAAYAPSGEPGMYRMTGTSPKLNFSLSEVMLKEPPAIGLGSGLAVVSFDFIVVEKIRCSKFIMQDDDT